MNKTLPRNLLATIDSFLSISEKCALYHSIGIRDWISPENKKIAIDHEQLFSNLNKQFMFYSSTLVFQQRSALVNKVPKHGAFSIVCYNTKNLHDDKAFLFCHYSIDKQWLQIPVLVHSFSRFFPSRFTFLVSASNGREYLLYQKYDAWTWNQFMVIDLVQLWENYLQSGTRVILDERILDERILDERILEERKMCYNSNEIQHDMHCWDGMCPNPSGTMLAVDAGSKWGGENYILVYDCRDIGDSSVKIAPDKRILFQSDGEDFLGELNKDNQRDLIYYDTVSFTFRWISDKIVTFIAKFDVINSEQKLIEKDCKYSGRIDFSVQGAARISQLKLLVQ